MKSTLLISRLVRPAANSSRISTSRGLNATGGARKRRISFDATGGESTVSPAARRRAAGRSRFRRSFDRDGGQARIALYVAKSGDTLRLIATRFLGNAERRTEILALNHRELGRDKEPRAGQRLVLPESPDGGRTRTFAPLPAGAKPQPVPVPVPPEGAPSAPRAARARLRQLCRRPLLQVGDEERCAGVAGTRHRHVGRDRQGEPGNIWAALDLWFDALAAKAEPPILKKCIGRLGGVDVFTRRTSRSWRWLIGSTSPRTCNDVDIGGEPALPAD